MNKLCSICGISFRIRPCLINIRKTCSKQCRHDYQRIALTGRKYSEEHKRKIGIGNLGKKYSEEACKKISDAMKGDKHWRWQGGAPQIIRKSTRKGGKHQSRYRYVMEKHLGRKLTSNEVVHHINGNPIDDRIENLMVMTASEHTKLHNQLIFNSKR